MPGIRLTPRFDHLQEGEYRFRPHHSELRRDFGERGFQGRRALPALLDYAVNPPNFILIKEQPHAALPAARGCRFPFCRARAQRSILRGEALLALNRNRPIFALELHKVPFDHPANFMRFRASIKFRHIT